MQLAHQAGAHLLAATSDPAAHGADLRTLGADEVITARELEAGVDAGIDSVVDLVGGQQLVHAFRALRPHGTLVAVGHSSGEGESFVFGGLFGNGGRHDRSISTFYLADTGAYTERPSSIWREQSHPEKGRSVTGGARNGE